MGTSNDNPVARKNDGGKRDLSLLPLVALEAMAAAFEHGEKKYGRYNYTAGFDGHRLVAAAMRHLCQWQNGEDLDPESGASHLGHALASIAMLLHTIQLGTNRDTRYKSLPIISPSSSPLIICNEAGTWQWKSDRWELIETKETK